MRWSPGLVMGDTIWPDPRHAVAGGARDRRADGPQLHHQGRLRQLPRGRPAPSRSARAPTWSCSIRTCMTCRLTRSSTPASCSPRSRDARCTTPAPSDHERLNLPSRFGAAGASVPAAPVCSAQGTSPTSSRLLWCQRPAVWRALSRLSQSGRFGRHMVRRQHSAAGHHDLTLKYVTYHLIRMA